FPKPNPDVETPSPKMALDLEASKRRPFVPCLERRDLRPFPEQNDRVAHPLKIQCLLFFDQTPFHLDRLPEARSLRSASMARWSGSTVPSYRIRLSAGRSGSIGTTVGRL